MRERSRATARPKSPILAVPSAAMKTLAGLRSRWTMPCSWMKARPRQTSLAIARVRATGGPSSPRPPSPDFAGEGREDWSSVETSPPDMYSWTMKGLPGACPEPAEGSSPMSWMTTRLGWARRAMDWASRRTRWRPCSSRPSARMEQKATSRSRRVSWARKTRLRRLRRGSGGRRSGQRRTRRGGRPHPPTPSPDFRGRGGDQKGQVRRWPTDWRGRRLRGTSWPPRWKDRGLKPLRNAGARWPSRLSRGLRPPHRTEYRSGAGFVRSP